MTHYAVYDESRDRFVTDPDGHTTFSQRSSAVKYMEYLGPHPHLKIVQIEGVPDE